MKTWPLWVVGASLVGSFAGALLAHGALLAAAWRRRRAERRARGRAMLAAAHDRPAPSVWRRG